MIETIEQLRAAVYGQAVGDALGVPYEFQDRGSFACANMIGHGTLDFLPTAEAGGFPCLAARVS